MKGYVSPFLKGLEIPSYNLKGTSSIFNHYFTKFYLLCVNLFKWDMPIIDNVRLKIPNDFIEKSLFQEGKLAFIHDKNMGYMITRCRPNGDINLYDEYTSYECYTNNNYSEIYNRNEVVILKNNCLELPTYYLLYYLINKLCEVENSITVNLENVRYPVIIGCSETERKTIENMFKQVKEGKHLIYGYKEVNKLVENIKIFDLKASYNVDKLEEEKDKILTELFTMLGINNANTQKKERLNTEEVNSNNQLIESFAKIMLNSRKIFCEEVKEKFNIEFNVEFNNENKVFNDKVNEGDNIE